MKNNNDVNKKMTYKITRIYSDENRRERTLTRGLTLGEAQKHCNDPETSSSTCTSPEKIRYTRKVGPWFDGYRVDTRRGRLLCRTCTLHNANDYETAEQIRWIKNERQSL